MGLTITGLVGPAAGLEVVVAAEEGVVECPTAMHGTVAPEEAAAVLPTTALDEVVASTAAAVADVGVCEAAHHGVVAVSEETEGIGVVAVLPAAATTADHP